ncbi:MULTISPECIES: AAA family ATPase [Methylobacteriaceae]|uniref:ATP-dependent zinc metalloprotease FtsH n=1 Tax=Methylorubrum suomiense TaxID=144191 RepID=A0ABQ4UTL8_9HYPH|nr:AAA family ATPase [Methylorubrum suomiense]GJE75149.1 ATP-dependent zinc metalloprotease FtsH [Methylorubrum suomiense]
MPEPNEAACAMARAFVEALRKEAASPDPSWCLDEAELDALALGRREASPMPRLAADVVAAAVMLGRAFAPAGPPAADDGFPVLLVRVSSPDWVEPMRCVVGPCLLGLGWRVRDGEGGRGAWNDRSRREVVVFARDGASREHRPDRGNETVGAAVVAGVPLIGVASDPARTLPRDFLRAVDREVLVAPLDAEVLSLVIEAVTGEVPPLAALGDCVSVRAAADLRLGIRPGRGASEALERLGRSRQRERQRTANAPRLEDTLGLGAARDWGLGLVADLRSWQEGIIPFAACESAVLVSGPPGTGKTRFAAALARSANLPLHPGSLAQWQGSRDGHLGHTLGAMRQFFEEARRSPCVVLIDELDSFGDRNTFLEHHRDYSSQVVNALLEHLDGAVGREGVVVVGTTNHPSRIDPAILRSGRLERHFRIELPGLDALTGMLVQYLGTDADDLDLAPVVPLLRGMTGADVEALVRRARGSARRAGRTLTVDDILAGSSDGTPALGDGLRMRCAVHEAGHAVALLASGASGPVTLTIAPTGGLTEHALVDAYGALTEGDFERSLVMILSGRAAEEVLLGDVSAGAVSDLAEATRCAAAMEASWGFSADFPLLSLAPAQDIDLARMPWLMRPVLERLRLAYERACDLMRTERLALERIAEALFRTAYLDDAATRALFSGKAASPRRRAGPGRGARRTHDT